MKIIILDTNILFSSILDPNSQIGEILFNNKQLEFFAPMYLRAEIDKHREKLTSISGLNPDDINLIIYHLYKLVHFIPDNQIPFQFWAKSAPLVREVDMDDLPFVALTIYLDGYLWTGDKKLIQGLESKGFKQCISTQELIDIITNQT